MQLIRYPRREEWQSLLRRPYVDNRAVMEGVQTIINAVRQHGDEALRSFTKKFDNIDLEQFEVSKETIEDAVLHLSPQLKAAMHRAKENIEKFHRAQMASSPQIMETMPGVQCWRKSVPIEKVGLYIPGGSAPLFSSVLMLAVPAAIAGCREIILCTPVNRQGVVDPAVLYAAKIIGVTRIFCIGGAQAIAAMAFGTESIPAVYKIFGPGNQYVTAAKQIVQMNGIAIDMPAGPSEVCVLADETANAAFVAADLLSQAEHGADSQVLLVSTHEETINTVIREVDAQLETLPRREMAEKALANSKAFLLANDDEAMELVNEYAPEHLIISCRNADALGEKVVNAGSVFMGNYSPESAGDYASGTNHTLPTNGAAKAYSGISIDSFVKKITYQKLSEEGLKNISDTVMEMAGGEGLHAHAQAVRIRLMNQ